MTRSCAGSSGKPSILRSHPATYPFRSPPCCPTTEALPHPRWLVCGEASPPDVRVHSGRERLVGGVGSRPSVEPADSPRHPGWSWRLNCRLIHDVSAAVERGTDCWYESSGVRSYGAKLLVLAVHPRESSLAAGPSLGSAAPLGFSVHPTQ